MYGYSDADPGSRIKPLLWRGFIFVTTKHSVGCCCIACGNGGRRACNSNRQRQVGLGTIPRLCTVTGITGTYMNLRNVHAFEVPFELYL